MKKSDFIICAPLHLVFMSNGVLALAQLARSIEKTGRSAFVCAYQYIDGRETVLSIDFDTYAPQNDTEKQFVDTIKRATKEFGIKMLKDFSQRRVDECYVVYPEAMLHNALNSKRVIRYFLNRDGIMSGMKVNVGADDFILAHSRVMHPNPHHVCYFAQLNPLFHDKDTYPAEHRKLDITYIGKGAAYGVTDVVPETVVITRTWPATKEQLAILLRNCRFFYTADACSNLNAEALACGAIPAFLDNGPWTNEEIDSFEPGAFPRLYEGIDAGDNFYAEFEVARAAYLERLRECMGNWDASVAQMIVKVDEHFAIGRSTSSLDDLKNLIGSGLQANGAARGKHEAQIPAGFGLQKYENPSSEGVTTEFGEKVGEYSFFPYRKHLLTGNGVRKWYAQPLVTPTRSGNPSFAVINQSDRPALCEGFALSARQLVLVTNPGEAMASRTRIASEGLYCVAVAFSPCTGNNEIFVSVCANGGTIWQQKIEPAESLFVYTGYLQLPANSTIDFVVNISQAGKLPDGVTVRFAIFECDTQTGALRARCDDNCSNLDWAQAAQWIAGTAFSPQKIEAASINDQQRGDAFYEHWTLDKKYLQSQFGRPPLEIARSVMEQRGEPTTRYAICLIPRSGSTLLAEFLAATGKLGYPIEYFVPDAERCLSLAFSDAFSSYDQLITNGFKSQNGVFGIEVEGERFLAERAFFSDLQKWRLVYMTRKDVLAQAISFARSLASGAWHSFGGTDAGQESQIDRATIVNTIDFLLRQERSFEQVFREEKVEPLRVAYEDLIAAPAMQASRIAEHIGVTGLDFSAVDVTRSVLKPTRGAVNRQYELAAIMQGGEFGGYNFHQIAEKRHVAVLAGVDSGLLSLDTERAPVLFIANDREALRARLATYMALQMTQPAQAASAVAAI